MDIRICIAELLSLHDCVIIPGFGGFIGNYSPARIDPVHHIFQPPAKKLLFNVNLKQNDGLLANAVASSFGTSYADACKLIEDFSELCRSTLKSGQPFFLPQVGKLNPGKEDIIYFEQDQNANLLPDAFGLTSFISPPVIRQSMLANDWNLPGQGLPQYDKKFVLPRALRWAAVLAIPAGIAALIGMTQYDRLSVSFSDNAGMLSSLFSKYSTTSLVERKEAPVVKLPARTKIVAPSSPAANPVAVNHDNPYAVIIGAFKVKENAENWVAELEQKGIDAYILDQSETGLYRITIGTSSDKTDVKKLLASARSLNFSGAWILTK